jgi:four helix bundle protein
MSIETYEDLDVWQSGHQVVLATYHMTRGYPSDERFGLVSQMRRAAFSIPANIVEGFRRRSVRDKIKFYNYSQSSLDELSYYYRASKDLGFLKDYSDVRRLLEATGRMLTNLIRKTWRMPSAR